MTPFKYVVKTVCQFRFASVKKCSGCLFFCHWPCLSCQTLSYFWDWLNFWQDYIVTHSWNAWMELQAANLCQQTAQKSRQQTSIFRQMVMPKPKGFSSAHNSCCCCPKIRYHFYPMCVCELALLCVSLSCCSKYGLFYFGENVSQLFRICQGFNKAA